MQSDAYVLITGASGFLGSHILLACQKQNKPVVTLGRRTISEDHILSDLSAPPDLGDKPYRQIIHVAGKAHSIPKNLSEAKQFYDTNHKGTLHLLTALEELPQKPQSFVFISTVAVYGAEKGENINEKAPLLGKTPYAKSKMLAEEAIVEWCKAHQVNYTILRLPLVVGKNPPGNLKKLKEAIAKRRYFPVKGNIAKKSMLLASDVAELILHTDKTNGVYNLTDGTNPSFYEVEKALEERTGKAIRFSIPLPAARLLAKIGDLLAALGYRQFPVNSLNLTKILSTLTFDDHKARKELNWKPNPVIPFIKNRI